MTDNIVCCLLLCAVSIVSVVLCSYYLSHTHNEASPDAPVDAPIVQKLLDVLDGKYTDWRIDSVMITGNLYTVYLKRRFPSLISAYGCLAPQMIELETFEGEPYEVAIAANGRYHTVFDKKLSKKIVHIAKHMAENELKELEKSL